MKKLLLLATLGIGLAIGGLGGASDAQAQPRPDGWHRGPGPGPHAMYRHGPRRHHGWERGHHRGWYKHRPRHHYRHYRY